LHHRSSLAALVAVVPALAFMAGCTTDFDRFLGPGGGGTGGGSTTTTTTTTSTGGNGTGGTGGGDVCNPPCEDNNPCTDNVCNAGACTYPTSVAPTLTDDPNDCQNPVCNGTILGQVADDTETPMDDGNDCTLETCVGGMAHPFATTGATCNGTGVCNSMGVCSSCNVPVDCGMDNLCVTWACTANACVPTYVPVNMEVADPTANDCKATFCNGTGTEITGNKDSDFSVNANVCLVNSCNNGTPATNNAPSTTTCDDAGSENNGRCTNGACVDCNANGGCDAGHVCQTNACCTPMLPAMVCGTNECGMASDGCGGMVSCGVCTADPSGPICLAGTCGCSQNSDCNGNNVGHDCLAVSGPDRCGCDMDNDCMGITGKTRCESASGVCSECAQDSHCSSNVKGEDCLPTFVCGCDMDADCLNVGTAHTCDLGTGVCNP
jgi:hypothetical protein